MRRRAPWRATEGLARAWRGAARERWDAQGGLALDDMLPIAREQWRREDAAAAKALSDYARETELLPFKGGILNGAPLTPDWICGRLGLRAPSGYRDAAGWTVHELDVPYGRRAAGTRSKVSGSVRGTARVIHDFAGVLR